MSATRWQDARNRWGHSVSTSPTQDAPPRRLQQLVQETAVLAGITALVYLSLLRHAVATTLLERGMP